MRTLRVKFKGHFRILAGTPRAQAAVMMILKGDSEGGPDNRHPRSDQWLYVESGTGTAIVKGRKIRLEPGVLLLIEKNEPHQIRNTGRKPLKTLNIYSPPAY